MIKNLLNYVLRLMTNKKCSINNSLKKIGILYLSLIMFLKLKQEWNIKIVKFVKNNHLIQYRLVVIIFILDACKRNNNKNLIALQKLIVKV